MWHIIPHMHISSHHGWTNCKELADCTSTWPDIFGEIDTQLVRFYIDKEKGSMKSTDATWTYLESLFTILIPEVESTIRARSGKSPMNLKYTTQTINFITQTLNHCAQGLRLHKSINYRAIELTGWKFREFTEYISFPSLWHLNVKFLLCWESSRWWTPTRPSIEPTYRAHWIWLFSCLTLSVIWRCDW